MIAELKRYPKNLCPDADKPVILDTSRKFAELGFRIKATNGTWQFLTKNGVPCERSFKISEHQRPNKVDEVKSKEMDVVINTRKGKLSAADDAYIRQSAIKYKVPYMTTTAAAKAAVQGIAAARSGRAEAKSLQAYHGEIEG